ncbi:hypothetical protein RIF29_15586 [Crotalaria pallida]|uniref:Uncharacterized protein n=1 Tax=Crotalaria pallida TaxID=3830 RepID=A0AAN9IDP7_CROPI
MNHCYRKLAQEKKKGPVLSPTSSSSCHPSISSNNLKGSSSTEEFNIREEDQEGSMMPVKETALIHKPYDVVMVSKPFQIQIWM